MPDVARGGLRTTLHRCNRPQRSSQWTPASTPSTSTPASMRSPASRGGWHPLTMATRMTSDRFVGRSAELAELRAALEEAIASRPSLALVGGESGVGKSRLADELARHAREAGVRVLSGDCVELGDDELPYAPLLTALRPLVRQGDPSLQALAPQLRSALDAILPGVGGGAAPERVAQSTRVRGAPGACSQALAEDGAGAARASRTCTGPTAPPASFIRFLSRSDVHRAASDRRHLPLRRAAPPPPAAAAAGRARQRPVHPPDRAAALHARGAGRAARGNPRPTRRAPSSWSACSRAARATRCTPRRSSPPGSTGAARCRPRCATR